MSGCVGRSAGLRDHRGTIRVASFASRIVPSLQRRVGEVHTRSVRRKLVTQLRELDRRNVSIMSNNCVAGILYEWAGLAKQTPTAGVYFVGPAYAQFLQDLSQQQLDRWMDVGPSSLVYKEAQRCWTLPAATGGELVFLHYPDPSIALEKWTRRLGRLHGRRLLIVSSIRDSIDAISLKKVLDVFETTFTVDGDPAPPADELVLDRRFLLPFSDYLDDVLAAAPEARLTREIVL